MEKNIKLTIEYDGSNYSGWQIQKNANSIQAELVKAIKAVTSEEVNLLGAGRTDAGVHALAQVANFKIKSSLEPERYKAALNHYLPNDILIHKSEDVSPEFHARFSAISRLYHFLVTDRRSTIHRKYRLFYRNQLDFGLLNRAAESIVGEHDFAPFCVVSSRKDDNLCRVTRAVWRNEGEYLRFEIEANRFLHSMVRSLVGGMLNLADPKADRNPQNLTLESFANMIVSSTDERSVFMAPAHGLYLVSVAY